MIKISSCTDIQQPKEGKWGQKYWSRCPCIHQVYLEFQKYAVCYGKSFFVKYFVFFKQHFNYHYFLNFGFSFITFFKTSFFNGNLVITAFLFTNGGRADSLNF